MTELSGGQTRALLIADATIICNTPIVLLDEVENAGIHRTRALELLRAYRKIFIFVTHDPRIALLSDYRIVMKGGSMVKVLHTDENETICAQGVSRLDDVRARLREHIRHGNRLTVEMMEGTNETGDLRGAGHDRQNFRSAAHGSPAARNRRAHCVFENRRAIRGGRRTICQRVRHPDEAKSIPASFVPITAT